MKSNPKNWATHGIFTNSQPRQRCISLCRLEVIPAILNGCKWFHHHLMNTFLKGIRASMHSFPSILRHNQAPKSISSPALRCGVFFSSHLKLEVSFLKRVSLKLNFNCSGMEYWCGIFRFRPITRILAQMDGAFWVSPNPKQQNREPGSWS